jgi:hypothetical protein
MVLKRGHFGKKIRNTWKVLICWAGEDGEYLWTDRAINEEVLQRVKKERNILQTIKRRKANWIAQELLSKTVSKGKIDGRIEVTGRRGRRPKQILDDLKERRE